MEDIAHEVRLQDWAKIVQTCDALDEGEALAAARVVTITMKRADGSNFTEDSYTVEKDSVANFVIKLSQSDYSGKDVEITLTNVVKK